MSDYDCEFHYYPDKANKVADTLNSKDDNITRGDGAPRGSTLFGARMRGNVLGWGRGRG